VVGAAVAVVAVEVLSKMDALAPLLKFQKVPVGLVVNTAARTR